MQIGKLSLKNQVFLAPMAGISDLPYRRLMKRFGAGLVFTEMISANGLIRDGRRTRELLVSAPEERPLGIQLFGDDPGIVAQATALVREDGELIDLNLGCPVHKVVRSGAGSALLRDPQRVRGMIAAIRQATDLPVTIKIRSGWDAQSINCLEIARIAVSEGVDAITLHPRTRAQGFSGRADWEWIRRLKEAVPVPVIGSGDIFSADDALAMFRQTGCDAVMIGRGAYGNPWLIRDILARLEGCPALTPTPIERQEAAELHMQLFLATFPPRKAVRELRKHYAWYSRGLPGAAQFRTQINALDSVEAMRAASNSFFLSVGNA